MVSASVSTFKNKHCLWRSINRFWGLKLNLYNFVTMTFFILLFRNRNGKDFSEINIWNFKKSYLAGPMREKIYGRIHFQWNCRARSTTLLNITFHWGSFLVNTSECSAFLQIGLKASSIKLKAVHCKTENFI